MARFNASSAFLRAGTIGGLAKAIAQPAYLQKVAAEPWVRRIVPFLVIMFLTAVWAGEIIQLNNARSEAIISAKVDLDQISALTNIDLQIELAHPATEKNDLNISLTAALGFNPLGKDRSAYMTDKNGTIVAAVPRNAIGQSIDTILGAGQPLTILADRAGVMRIQLADGIDALAVVRNLGGAYGQLAFVQPIDTALASWWKRARSTALLAAASTIVIGALGVAFFQQSARATEADFICAEVRRRIDTVLSSGRSGLWDWDLPRGRIFWSDSMYALIGHSRSSEFLSFKDIQHWLHPDDQSPFDSAGYLMEQKALRIDHEFRLRHADGRWLWIRARGQLINDSDVTHLVGIAVDITEEKASAALQATADMRVRDAIESISEAFALFDAQQALVVANSKYQKLHLLPNDLMAAGTHHSKIAAVNHGKRVDVQIPLTICTKSGNQSYEMQLSDGRWFHVNERATKDGGHVSISSDISDHKAYEGSLAASNVVLEQTVEDLERSKQALQQQTYQLKELSQRHLEQKAVAESANRAKAEFLANMSHELFTPLNHIIGFAEMMESNIYGPLGNERYGEYTKNIGESGRYLLEVISDILDMSSLEAGRIKLERHQIALTEIIDDAVEQITPAAREKNISISIEKIGPLHVVGDQKAFSQIISNLLCNAVKFTHDGGRIGLRAKRSGDAVHLFFEDNGSGITAEDIDKIGRPFEQSGSVMENGFKGSGLGSSIAKALTELHGGNIRIKSKVGIGTIVMVILPVSGVETLLQKNTDLI
jgi:two-component system, cell cycle sensor histidine kinase PleC